MGIQTGKGTRYHSHNSAEKKYYKTLKDLKSQKQNRKLVQY